MSAGEDARQLALKKAQELQDAAYVLTKTRLAEECKAARFLNGVAAKIRGECR